MKRWMLNLSALAIIAAGSSVLSSAANAQTEVTAPATCTAANGASCTGSNCCANADRCYASCPW
jgi:hypothetical protein